MSNESIVSIWWKYIKSEKKCIILWFLFLVGAFLVEYVLASFYTKMTVPEVTLKDVFSQLYEWVEGAFKSSTTTDDKINPILVVISIISGGTFVQFIFKIWGNGTKDRYESLFLTSNEQKLQNIIKRLVYFLMMFIWFFVLFVVNLFNTIDKIAFNGKSKLLFICISFLFILAGILWNCFKLKKDGRTNISSFLVSFFVIMIWGLYPVEEANLMWICVHSFLASITTIWLLQKMGADLNMQTSIYSFSSEKEARLYIHYRLDESRVVCTPEAKLSYDSKLVIVDISDLCKREIRKDITVYDKEWLDTIEKIALLKAVRRKASRKKLRLVIAQCGKVFKKACLSIKSLINDIGKKISIINKQKKVIRELKNENSMLVKRIEDMKNN